MKVKVRWDDILLGERKEPNTCAIARALKRTTGLPNVQVYPSFATVRNGIHKRYSLPSKATEFIRDFDRKGKFSVRPFTFEATEIDEH